MGGGSGRTYGKDRRGRRLQGDEEKRTGRGEIRSLKELPPELGREINVCGEEMVPPLRVCNLPCIMKIDFSE